MGGWTSALGLVVSAAGLAAAVWAAFTARAARRAADAARLAIRRGDGRDDLSGLFRSSESLVYALSKRDLVRARTLAAEIRARVGMWSSRSAELLGLDPEDDSLSNLQAALTILDEQLVETPGAQVTSADAAGLQKLARTCMSGLGRLLGHVERELDRDPEVEQHGAA